MSAPPELMTPPVPPAQQRRAFMMAHDHLISPWKYSPDERAERDQALHKTNWMRNTQQIEDSLLQESLTKLSELTI